VHSRGEGVSLINSVIPSSDVHRNKLRSSRHRIRHRWISRCRVNGRSSRIQNPKCLGVGLANRRDEQSLHRDQARSGVAAESYAVDCGIELVWWQVHDWARGWEGSFCCLVDDDAEGVLVGAAGVADEFAAVGGDSETDWPLVVEAWDGQQVVYWCLCGVNLTSELLRQLVWLRNIISMIQHTGDNLDDLPIGAIVYPQNGVRAVLVGDLCRSSGSCCRRECEGGKRPHIGC